MEVCQAHSWQYPCRVVAGLEAGELGSNPRFIISSRYDDDFKLYYEQCCFRGVMTGIIATTARSNLYRLTDETESYQPIIIMGKRNSAVLVS